MGTGAWGTVFCHLLDRNLTNVRLWGNDAELMHSLQETRTNPKYHPELRFSNSLIVASDPNQALQGAEIVCLAIPAQRLRENLEMWAKHIPADAVVVSLIKGIERNTQFRVSEIVAEFINNSFAVISGPNLATEIAQGQPAAATIAAQTEDVAKAIQQTLSTSNFRLYRSIDVIGVEVAGTVKNIVAVGVGIAIGMGFGENVQSAILTRGLAEMAELGAAMGARSETFLGLAGIGDLIATSQSPLSRNRSFGQLLGAGLATTTALDQVGQTVESLKSAEPIMQLASKYSLNLPLLRAISLILKGELTANSLMEVFLTTELTAEI